MWKRYSGILWYGRGFEMIKDIWILIHTKIFILIIISNTMGKKKKIGYRFTKEYYCPICNQAHHEGSAIGKAHKKYARRFRYE